MSNTTPSSMKEWNVMVTLSATMTGWVKVEANSHDEAGDKATETQTVIANASQFSLDENNFHSWASDAYLPDPDNGIVPHSSESPLGIALSDMTPFKVAIMNAASEGYNTFGYGVDLMDQTSPDVSSDGLALFIARELKDVMMDAKDEDCKRESVVAMESAIEELKSVIHHISNL